MEFCCRIISKLSWGFSCGIMTYLQKGLNQKVGSSYGIKKSCQVVYLAYSISMRNWLILEQEDFGCQGGEDEEGDAARGQLHEGGE